MQCSCTMAEIKMLNYLKTIYEYEPELNQNLKKI